MKVWVDGPPVNGQYKDQYRVARQTSNPKRGNDWNNKPKKGNYYPLVVLYLDGIDHDGSGTQHVEAHQIYRADPARHARLQADGTYAQLSREDRIFYEYMVRATRKHNPAPWDRWDAAMACITARIAAHGDVPATRDDLPRETACISEDDYVIACEVAKHNAGL
jgi:hypothetical protein